MSAENLPSLEAALGGAIAALRVEGFRKAADCLERSLNAAKAGKWRDSRRLAYEAAGLEMEARRKSGRLAS